MADDVDEQEQYRRAEAVLAVVSELPAAEWSAAIRAACGEDVALLARVERLADALRRADGFLADPGGATTVGATAGDGDVAAVSERPGSRVGRYKLLQQIGEGGFGVVFLAEQEEPVRRQVALKVIKLGMDTREVVARFEAERQALALMDHPNIARVFDAGSTGTGRPYFVMELVRGSPITAYADEHRLTPADRVALVADVCRAVQHAHSKGVIHRDLKPANVLVTVADGRPVPKVIDFGIAKATAGTPTDQTPFTGFRQRVGTPQYMSPEQADGSGTDLDTRTDVYSLGVVLYELLVGATPVDPRQLRAAAHDAVWRVIRDVDPPRPSTRLSGLGQTLATVAANRRTDARRLGQMLHGELDWIVMRALEKDRNRRYDTAAALADDLVRYLAGEAVLAGPVGGAYRLRKLAWRHRTAVGVAAAVAVALLLGVAGTTAGLLREAHQRRLADAARRFADDQRHAAEAARADADQQRRRAEARFADVRSLADDLMYTFDDALATVAGATPARKLLAATALTYLDRLSHDAAADRSLAHDLADGYDRVGDVLGNPGTPNVGDAAGALASYRKGLAGFEALAAADPQNVPAALDVARGYAHVGEIQQAMGHRAEADAAYGRWLDRCESLVRRAPADPAVRKSLADAYLHRGQLRAETGGLADGLDDCRRAVDLDRQSADADPSNVDAAYDLSRAVVEVGRVQARAGRTADALASFRAALDLGDRLARGHPADARAQRNLALDHGWVGQVELDTGRTADAVAEFRTAATIAHRLTEADPANAAAARDLAVALGDLGRAQAAAGRSADAAAAYREAVAIAGRLATADPTAALAAADLASLQCDFGGFLADAGHPQEALAPFQAALATADRLARDRPDATAPRRRAAVAHRGVGRSLDALGRPADALASFRAALSALQPLAAADPADAVLQRDVGIAYTEVGTVQAELSQPADALASYQSALAIDRQLAAADPADARTQQRLSRDHQAIGEADADLGRPADALASYDAGLAITRRLAAADPADAGLQRDLLIWHGRYGELHATAGRLAAAAASYQEAVEVADRLSAADPADADARHNLAATLSRLGKVRLRMAGDPGRPVADRAADARVAAAAFRRAREAVAGAAAGGVRSATDVGWMAELDGEIRAAEDQVGRLQGQPATGPTTTSSLP